MSKPTVDELAAVLRRHPEVDYDPTAEVFFCATCDADITEPGGPDPADALARHQARMLVNHLTPRRQDPPATASDLDDDPDGGIEWGLRRARTGYVITAHDRRGAERWRLLDDDRVVHRRIGPWVEAGGDLPGPPDPWAPPPATVEEERDE